MIKIKPIDSAPVTYRALQATERATLSEAAKLVYDKLIENGHTKASTLKFLSAERKLKECRLNYRQFDVNTPF